MFGIGLNGAASDYHFIKCQPERVEVRTGIDRAGADLFGRHVGQSADSQPGAGEPFGASGTRDAEIGELHSAAGTDQNIGGFDIAVNHAAFVRERQRREHLGNVAERRTDVDGAILEHLFQTDAFDQFQEHEQAAFNSLRRVERGDVGMLKAGVDFDLAKEAVGQRRILIKVGKNNLHGLLTLGDEAAHTEDLAHTAAA